MFLIAASRNAASVPSPSPINADININEGTRKEQDLQLFSDTPDWQRRSIITNVLVAAVGTSTCFTMPQSATAVDGKLAELLVDVKKARAQMNDIPDLIKDEKWDAGK